MTQLGVTQQFHRQLRDDEAEVRAVLERRYVELRREMQAELDALQNQIQERLESGREPSISWLQRQARYETLVSELESEISRIADGLEVATDQLRSNAVRLGSEYAHQMGLDAGVDNMVRLTNVEVQDLIARGRADTAYRNALRKLPSEAAEGVERALIHGVVAGQSPDQVARRVTQSLGGNMAQARTIARTEMMTAYRNASILSYQKNADLYEGWVWTAAVFNVPGPCPTCLANHGKVFPLSQALVSHPNCRCAPAPKVRDRPSTIERETERIEAHVPTVDPSQFKDYRDIDLQRAALKGQYRSRVSKEQQNIILQYQGIHYETINGTLRNSNRIRIPMSDDDLARYVDALDQAIDDFPMPGNGIVHRATSQFNDLDVGTIITDPGYVSTTLDPEVVAYHARLGSGRKAVKILMPEDAKGAYLDVLSPIGEQEVLLPRGSQFRVISQTEEEVIIEWIGIATV